MVDRRAKARAGNHGPQFLRDLQPYRGVASGATRGSSELVASTRGERPSPRDQATRARGADRRIERDLATARSLAQPVAPTLDTCRGSALAASRRVDESQPGTPTSCTHRPALLLQRSPRARRPDCAVDVGAPPPSTPPN